MLMRAAVRVFTSSIAMVMGPTPPGTGVMASALADTGFKVHVALQPVAPAAAGVFHPVYAHVNHHHPPP